MESYVSPQRTKSAVPFRLQLGEVLARFLTMRHSQTLLLHKVLLPSHQVFEFLGKQLNGPFDGSSDSEIDASVQIVDAFVRRQQIRSVLHAGRLQVAGDSCGRFQRVVGLLRVFRRYLILEATMSISLRVGRIYLILVHVVGSIALRLTRGIVWIEGKVVHRSTRVVRDTFVGPTSLQAVKLGLRIFIVAWLQRIAGGLQQLLHPLGRVQRLVRIGLRFGTVSGCSFLPVRLVRIVVGIGGLHAGRLRRRVYVLVPGGACSVPHALRSSRVAFRFRWFVSHEIVQDQHRLRLLCNFQAIASRHRVRFSSDSHFDVRVVLIVEIEFVVDAGCRLRVILRIAILVPGLAYSRVLQRFRSEYSPTRRWIVSRIFGITRWYHGVVGITAVRFRILPFSFIVGIEQHLQRRGFH